MPSLNPSEKSWQDERRLQSVWMGSHYTATRFQTKLQIFSPPFLREQLEQPPTLLTTWLPVPRVNTA